VNHTTPRLCDFGFFWRFGVGVLVICLVGGYIVSGVFLKQHYENRDGRAGVSFTDIQGAYAGAVVPSQLGEALERGHPDDLPDADRQALLDWLASDTVKQDYENFDLGDAMPADIIAVSCVQCHARSATVDGAFPSLPLEYADDVLKVAVGSELLPKDKGIVIQSLHAHAPSMAACALVLAILCGMTRWPRCLVGVVVSLAALGLLADLSGQWLARTEDAKWTWAIVVGGFFAAGGVGVMGLLALADAWLPGGTRRDEDA